MMSQSVRQADRSLHRAVMLAAGTSAIGYAVLVASPLALMREFGLVLAASVGLSYAAALFVVWVWPPRIEPDADGHTDDTDDHRAVPDASGDSPVTPDRTPLGVS